MIYRTVTLLITFKRVLVICFQEYIFSFIGAILIFSFQKENKFSIDEFYLYKIFNLSEDIMRALGEAKRSVRTGI